MSNSQVVEVCRLEADVSPTFFPLLPLSFPTSSLPQDLHRTGNTGFTTEEEHAILKRVLLAYARFNKSTGYCQGFNIMAALILKVVSFNEQLALKVRVNRGGL